MILTNNIYGMMTVPSSSEFLAFFFFFQAEDGIRDLVRSRGLGDVYKRQDAHRDDDVFRAAALALDQRMADQARAGDAVGMALSLIHI